MHHRDNYRRVPTPLSFFPLSLSFCLAEQGKPGSKIVPEVLNAAGSAANSLAAIKRASKESVEAAKGERNEGTREGEKE